MKLEKELHIQKPLPPYYRAMLNVMFTGQWLVEGINQVLKPFEISEPQYNVLRILRGRQGEAITAQEIQERMIHRSSNITRIIEKLRLKELVTRTQCESNRRKVDILKTGKGLELLVQLDKALDVHHEPLRQQLTPSELNTLAELLDKLRQ